MDKKITKKQHEVLQFIKKYTVEHGFPPSIREICAGLNLSSPATVHVHLKHLEEAGCIRKTNSKFRTIEVLVENEFEEHNEDVAEHMIDYLRMSAEVMGTQLFVLCNLKLFFNGQEMQYLYEQALYHKFSLLLVEGHIPDGKEKGEKWMIVDKDNCVIVPDGV